jgi:hypothetical protein
MDKLIAHYEKENQDEIERRQNSLPLDEIVARNAKK